jgi:TM2 domain-containing membrane protein YozV
MPAAVRVFHFCLPMATQSTPLYLFQQESSMQLGQEETHSSALGYLLWIFGFLGVHRFYYGKPVTGTLWFFTLGLLGIGWLIDLFLIPSMAREADLRFKSGVLDYNVAWIFLAFLGFFGVHRMYQGKWVTGILYLCTGGLFMLGVLYDFWTLNGQISLRNAQSSKAAFQVQ